jgi:hypothetical protein
MQRLPFFDLQVISRNLIVTETDCSPLPAVSGLPSRVDTDNISCGVFDPAPSFFDLSCLVA